MRHYDRVNYRHLNDSERYRDHEYLADDAWVGPNERVPHGATDENEPPWSTLGGYETGAFLADRVYDRGYARARSLTHRLEYPREGVAIDERTQAPRPVNRMGGRIADVRDAVRHPGSFLGRVVRGLFHGKGPKNWMRSDTRLHDEVCERLAAHEHIDASDIDVVVKDGEVTLTGSVPDRRMKRLADAVLDEVMGLHDVHNRLRVATANASQK